MLAAIVSDGAGSASHGGEGAGLACSVLGDAIAESYETGLRAATLSQEIVLGWIERLQTELIAAAAEDGLAPRDYACTVLLAVVEPKQAAFLQIGDGVIVISSADGTENYECVFWPQSGEYVNETHFVTDENASEHVDFKVIGGPVDEIVLLSDGLQAVALNYLTRTAHSPFFRSFLAPVRPQPLGHSERLSVALSQFLASSEVNERTDDDKSMVIASRRKVSTLTLQEDHPYDHDTCR